ncbi:MAG: Y-family DNA polymerase [Rubrivivax sp.]|nr:Y-family DNA polymerase [Pyrinomonadaceae bacterium]
MRTAIAFVDANEFYVSCERVFDAKLRGRPVVVLSNNDGCIISRSGEAKALGITMGAPLFKVRQVVEENDVAVFSSNYQLYGDLSLRLADALHEFTPDVEAYSIDEAFLGLEARPDQSFREYGLEIKAKVYKWTGVPCSLGISQTKTLAKVAQRFTKKHPEAQGVLDLTDPSEQSGVLEQTPVGDVWGVGPAYAKMLKGAGITTALKLRDADRRWIRQRMTVVGARVVEELRGVNCLPLERCPQARKSVTCSRSFGVLVESIEELREAVALYMTKAAERLRRSKLAAGVVTVFVTTSRFGEGPQYSNSVTFELAYSTDSTDELLRWVLKGLGQIYRAGFRYKKAGVMLNKLSPADNLTMRLYGDERFERARRVMKAVDEINARYGRDTVRFGALRPRGRWEAKFLRRSRHYTTSLAEVLRVA